MRISALLDAKFTLIHAVMIIIEHQRNARQSQTDGSSALYYIDVSVLLGRLTALLEYFELIFLQSEYYYIYLISFSENLRTLKSTPTCD